jgi:hypothetical protein
MDGSLHVNSGSAYRRLQETAPSVNSGGLFSYVQGRVVGECPHCYRVLQLTKDHILPYRCIKRMKPCRRVKSFPADGVNNIRWVCAQCNLLRGVAADCPAILAAAYTVGDHTGWNVKFVLRLWGFMAPKKLKSLATLNVDYESLVSLRRKVYRLVEDIRQQTIEMSLTK